jgi:hypothetical protein
MNMAFPSSGRHPIPEKLRIDEDALDDEGMESLLTAMDGFKPIELTDDDLSKWAAAKREQRDADLAAEEAALKRIANTDHETLSAR